MARNHFHGSELQSSAAFPEQVKKETSEVPVAPSQGSQASPATGTALSLSLGRNNRGEVPQKLLVQQQRLAEARFSCIKGNSAIFDLFIHAERLTMKPLNFFFLPRDNLGGNLSVSQRGLYYCTQFQCLFSISKISSPCPHHAHITGAEWR